MKNFVVSLSFVFGLFVALPSYAGFWGEALRMITFGVYNPSAKPDGVDAKSYKEIEDQKRKLNGQSEELNKDLNSLRGEIESDNSTLNEMRASIKKHQEFIGHLRQANSLEDKNLAESSMFNQNQLNIENTKKQLQTMETKVSKIEDKLKEKIAVFNKGQEKLAELQKQISNYNDASDRLVSLENDIKAMKVLSTIDEFKDEIEKTKWEAEIVAEAFERVYDRSLMAAYMQKKFEDLLNSKTLCEATKMCNENGQASGLNAKEIFKKNPYQQLKTRNSSRSTQ